MEPTSDYPRPRGRGSRRPASSKPRPSSTVLSDGNSRDAKRADKVIRFIEALKVPSGVGQGGFFKLHPFQKQFIRDIYEPHSDGRRIVRRAILSIARKNGKTALIAGLALAHLVGPEAIPNGEIYSAANDREQAAQVFKVARQIVEADPELIALVSIIPSTKTLVGRRTGSFYRALSAEAGTKFGFNPSVVIYDELAQAKNRALYDALDSSMGARLEPLFAVISTQSNDPEHILSQLIDDGLHSGDPAIVCQLHAVPEEVEDIFDEEIWKLANPALGTFRTLDDMRALAAKAKRMPSEEPKFRNLYLNQRVAPTASLIARAEWMACEGKPEFQDGEAVYLALDLSSVNDLTALMMASADDPTRVKPFFWKPEKMLHEHSKRDFGSGNRRFAEWVEAGWLLTTPGRSIDPQVIATLIAELCQRYQVKGFAYDRWRIADLRREFDRIGFATYQDDEKHGAGLRMVPWGQGFKDMAPAIDALELAIMDRTLIHPGSPLLTWNMANAVSTMDPAGNRKIDKENVRFRIDGAVALAMVMGLKARDRQGPVLDIATMIA